MSVPIDTIEPRDLSGKAESMSKESSVGLRRLEGSLSRLPDSMGYVGSNAGPGFHKGRPALFLEITGGARPGHRAASKSEAPPDHASRSFGDGARCHLKGDAARHDEELVIDAASRVAALTGRGNPEACVFAEPLGYYRPQTGDAEAVRRSGPVIVVIDPRGGPEDVEAARAYFKDARDRLQMATDVAVACQTLMDAGVVARCLGLGSFHAVSGAPRRLVFVAWHTLTTLPADGTPLAPGHLVDCRYAAPESLLGELSGASNVFSAALVCLSVLQQRQPYAFLERSSGAGAIARAGDGASSGPDAGHQAAASPHKPTGGSPSSDAGPSRGGAGSSSASASKVRVSTGPSGLSGSYRLIDEAPAEPSALRAAAWVQHFAATAILAQRRLEGVQALVKAEPEQAGRLEAELVAAKREAALRLEAARSEIDALTGTGAASAPRFMEWAADGAAKLAESASEPAARSAGGTAEEAEAARQRVREAAMQPVREAGGQLCGVIRDCLHPLPDQRPSLDKLVGALQAVGALLGGDAESEERPIAAGASKGRGSDSGTVRAPHSKLEESPQVQRRRLSAAGGTLPVTGGAATETTPPATGGAGAAASEQEAAPGSPGAAAAAGGAGTVAAAPRRADISRGAVMVPADPRVHRGLPAVPPPGARPRPLKCRLAGPAVVRNLEATTSAVTKPERRAVMGLVAAYACQADAALTGGAESGAGTSGSGAAARLGEALRAIRPDGSLRAVEGGVAGGIKVIDSRHGLFLRVCRPESSPAPGRTAGAGGLYGGSAVMAAKPARLELSVLKYLGRKSPSNALVVPRAELCDTRVLTPAGHVAVVRVSAQTLLPVGDGTLVSGSPDGGRTLHVAPTARPLLDTVARAFHLAPSTLRPQRVIRHSFARSHLPRPPHGRLAAELGMAEVAKLARLGVARDSAPTGTCADLARGELGVVLDPLARWSAAHLKDVETVPAATGEARGPPELGLQSSVYSLDHHATPAVRSDATVAPVGGYAPYVAAASTAGAAAPAVATATPAGPSAGLPRDPAPVAASAAAPAPSEAAPPTPPATGTGALADDATLLAPQTVPLPVDTEWHALRTGQLAVVDAHRLLIPEVELRCRGSVSVVLVRLHEGAPGRPQIDAMPLEVKLPPELCRIVAARPGNPVPGDEASRSGMDPYAAAASASRSPGGAASASSASSAASRLFAFLDSARAERVARYAGVTALARGGERSSLRKAARKGPARLFTAVDEADEPPAAGATTSVCIDAGVVVVSLPSAPSTVALVALPGLYWQRPELTALFPPRAAQQLGGAPLVCPDAWQDPESGGFVEAAERLLSSANVELAWIRTQEQLAKKPGKTKAGFKNGLHHLGLGMRHLALVAELALGAIERSDGDATGAARAIAEVALPQAGRPSAAGVEVLARTVARELDMPGWGMTWAPEDPGAPAAAGAVTPGPALLAVCLAARSAAARGRNATADQAHRLAGVFLGASERPWRRVSDGDNVAKLLQQWWQHHATCSTEAVGTARTTGKPADTLAPVVKPFGSVMLPRPADERAALLALRHVQTHCTSPLAESAFLLSIPRIFPKGSDIVTLAGARFVSLAVASSTEADADAAPGAGAAASAAHRAPAPEPRKHRGPVGCGGVAVPARNGLAELTPSASASGRAGTRGPRRPPAAPVRAIHGVVDIAAMPAAGDAAAAPEAVRKGAPARGWRSDSTLSALSATTEHEDDAAADADACGVLCLSGPSAEAASGAAGSAGADSAGVVGTSPGAASGGCSPPQPAAAAGNVWHACDLREDGGQGHSGKAARPSAGNRRT